MEENAKFDIMQHHLVPKHEIISKDEKEQLLKKYNISLKQIPFILSEDPIVKNLNAKEDDVIKITRKSPTAGESVYYRVIIHG